MRPFHLLSAGCKHVSLYYPQKIIPFVKASESAPKSFVLNIIYFGISTSPSVHLLTTFKMTTLSYGTEVFLFE